MELKEALSKVAELEVEKAKLKATIEDIKASREEVKETNKALVAKVETLETQNTDLTGKVKAIETAELGKTINKLATEEFKVKEKFAELLFKQADLGEEVDYTNLTEEQKEKVSKVIEANPEFKLDISEMGGAVPQISTEEVLGQKAEVKDTSNISNM